MFLLADRKSVLFALVAKMSAVAAVSGFAFTGVGEKIGSNSPVVSYRIVKRAKAERETKQ